MTSLSSNDGVPSLLIPANPSLSTEKPQHSILLNGTGRTPSFSASQATTSELSLATSTSQTDTDGSLISSPPSTSTFPSSASPFPSGHSPQPSTSSFVSGISSPTAQSPKLSRRDSTSSPKISFAPLPSVPPEYKLQRRNSITLGVASRRNLLTGQGGPGGAPGGGQKVGRLYMNEADWEAYKQQYEAKGNDPVDLGQLATRGAKALWGKVKRSRSASNSSQASISNISTTGSVSSPSKQLVHRSSAPELPQIVVAPGPGPGPGTPNPTSALGTVEEEQESPTQSTSGRAHITPGSPPPRARSPSMISTASGSTIISESEDGSAGGSGSGDGSEAGISPSSRTHRESAPWTHGPRKGVLVDHPPGHIHVKDIYPGFSADRHGAGSAVGDGDGDATPRRRPSPPPPMRVDSDDLAEQEEEAGAEGDEDEEEEGEEEYDDSASAMQQDIEQEGRQTLPTGPSARSETEDLADLPELAGTSPDREKKVAQAKEAKARDWEKEHESGRRRRAAVLGFDEERFGHLSLGPSADTHGSGSGPEPGREV